MQTARAFLVRCWQEGHAEPPIWRFAVVEIGGAPQTRGFADFETLVRFLSAEILGEISPEKDVTERIADIGTRHVADGFREGDETL